MIRMIRNQNDGLVARILRPTGIEVEHFLFNGEDAMTFVEVSRGERLVVGEELNSFSTTI